MQQRNIIILRREYLPWTAAEADNFNYTSSAVDNEEVEDWLNIMLPRDVCEYWVDDATGTIYFRRADTNDPVGNYVILTDTYDIDAAYDKYLGYLE